MHPPTPCHVTRQGYAADGLSSRMLVCVDPGRWVPHQRMPALRALPVPRNFPALARTGTIVNWFKRTLVGPETSYSVLDAEAAAVPPGCDGLSCLDHFQGNRTPHTDPLSRGAVVGLTLAHTRGHVFR
eukprot:364938-Chlamydomonas_euryale.AAC.31